jgi:8-oxo-dGTP pyrophosphatase MutT (NUDIX family)
MAPAVRAAEAERADQRTARSSGVMVLLFPDEVKNMRLVFMERTQDGGAHSGQISFPGGKAEPTDKDLLHTALRETFEEVGVDSREIEVIRGLSELYVPPSHFVIYPFMGILSTVPRFRPDPTEVASILTPSLSELMDPYTSRTLHVRSSRYGAMDVPCYQVDGYSIWGATAMILSEALSLIKQANINRVS